MPRTTTYRRGTVVLVRFPFTDLESSKQRPAVVLSSDAYHHDGADVIVAPISASRSDKPGQFDHPVEDWKGAGLLKPSIVRAGKVVTLDRSLVRRRLGRISPAELLEVEGLLKAALALAPGESASPETSADKAAE